MNEQTMKRILSVGILTSLGIGLLTGCTEKAVDYNIEGTEETMQTEENVGNSGKVGLAQFTDTLTWNDKWKMDDGENMVELVVNADILLPELEQMSVIEVVEPEFDANYKEQVVKGIFKDGEVYYNDVPHRPKKELEELYTAYEEEYQSASEDNREELKKSLEECETALENAKDTYTLAEEYGVNEYLGKLNGISFGLRFDKPETATEYETGEAWKFRNKGIWLYPKDIYEVCPETVAEYPKLIYMVYPYDGLDVNECIYSEEEAQELARSFVDALGMEYPVLTDVRPLVWGDEGFTTEKWTPHGYVFTYDYGVEDVSFVGFGYEGDYSFEKSSLDNEVMYSMRAQMLVYVTDKGVIQMETNSPVETTGVEENVELLPLDVIQGIMKEQTQNNRELFHFTYEPRGVLQDFTHMELIYFRVKDKENAGHYSYVPAWRLSYQNEKTVFGVTDVKIIENPVIINAIDGSVIDIGNEV